MPRICGIYKLQSLSIPERIYIGSSNHLLKRKSEHYSALRKNKHYSKKMQRHAEKYGINDLVFSIIEEVSEAELIKREQCYLDLHRPYFNSSPTAGRITGYKHTEEIKLKMSRLFKGRKRDPEAVKRGAEKLIGRKATPETIQKIKDSRRNMSAEWRRKISLQAKIRSPDARRRISAGAIKRFGSKNGRARKISCPTLYGITFDTIREAADVLGLYEESVRKVINNRRKQVGGFVFQYLNKTG